MNATVHTLTDDYGREYEAFISEEIQERHYSPDVVIQQKITVVECVKYRGEEVKNFSELAVLDDWDTQARIADINLNELTE